MSLSLDGVVCGKYFTFTSSQRATLPASSGVPKGFLFEITDACNNMRINDFIKTVLLMMFASYLLLQRKSGGKAVELHRQSDV